MRLFTSCTKGSLRSPSVQRAAASPQSYEALPPVALRTTAVLQNWKKKSSLRSILFPNFAKPPHARTLCVMRIFRQIRISSSGLLQDINMKMNEFNCKISIIHFLTFRKLGQNITAKCIEL